MFLSSLAPLLVVFALLDTFRSGAASLLCVLVAVVSVVGHFALLLALRNGLLGSATREHSYDVSSAEERGGDVMAYVATYLIPFVGFRADDTRSTAALAIFVLVIGVLYVRSGLFAVNPMLALVGFHLYRAELHVAGKGARPTSLLLRANVPPGPMTVQAHQLGPDLLVAFGKDVMRGQ